MEKLEAKPSFRIVKNEPAIQSVVSSDQKWFGIAFYQAGKSELLGGIEADQPCAVLLKKEKKELSVSVADPTQKLSQVRLTLKGAYRAENPAVTVTSSQGNSVLTISLPKGGEAGKTVTVALK